jgi:hypothetical protein
MASTGTTSHFTASSYILARMRTAIQVVVAVALLSGTAAAQSKSWNAVQKTIDPKAEVVVGINLKSIRTTTTYASGLQLLLQQEESAKQAFEMIKTSCSIDVPTAVSDAVFVMKDDKPELMVLGLDGVDEAKAVACLQQIGQQKSGKTDIKISSKKKGKITEYSVPGEDKKLYVAWLAPDVLAFTEDPTDKAKITKALAGSKPKGLVGTGIGKVNTGAAIWAAVAKKDKESFGTMLGGYGQLEIASGTLTVTGHVIWSKPAEAQTALTEAQKGLGEAKTEAAKYPKVQKLLGTVVLGATGKELDFKASADDKDIMSLVADFDHVF